MSRTRYRATGHTLWSSLVIIVMDPSGAQNKGLRAGKITHGSGKCWGKIGGRVTSSRRIRWFLSAGEH